MSLQEAKLREASRAERQDNRPRERVLDVEDLWKDWWNAICYTVVHPTSYPTRPRGHEPAAVRGAGPISPIHVARVAAGGARLASLHTRTQTHCFILCLGRSIVETARNTSKTKWAKPTLIKKSLAETKAGQGTHNDGAFELQS